MIVGPSLVAPRMTIGAVAVPLAASVSKSPVKLPVPASTTWSPGRAAASAVCSCAQVATLTVRRAAGSSWVRALTLSEIRAVLVLPPEVRV